MTQIADNLTRLEDAVAAACRQAGRRRDEVELVAVSKTHPAAALIEAFDLGIRLFGENRVQEFAQKSSTLPTEVRSRMRAHLIGHLQSNKAAKAVEVFDAVDSVDSLKLADRLDEAARKVGKRLPVLIEIKLSEEETKAGLSPSSSELAQLFERLPELFNLDVQGLMTIAPFNVPEEETRACFRALRVLRDQLASIHPRLSLPVLSMGMSGDFPLAIAEGATRIRVGTALFGAREYPASFSI
jgi:pyridoxal phosphate enzyme (YggS family)